MKRINISTPKYPNSFALVDNDDYIKLSKHKWMCKCGYAVRHHIFKELPLDKKGIWVNMARIIMGLYSDDGMEIDHKNLNRLDNRKTNLRICTRSQNMANKRPIKNKTSAYKGVWIEQKANKWKSTVGYKSKKFHLGYFDNEIEAAIAYDKKAKELFGEYARLNFPTGLNG